MALCRPSSSKRGALQVADPKTQYSPGYYGCSEVSRARYLMLCRHGLLLESR